MSPPRKAPSPPGRADPLQPLVLAVLSLAAALPASCGYRVGGLYEDYRAGVRVAIFDNRTERRTHEFDLAQATVREMAARGIHVNTPDAPFTLTGRILDMRTPSVVEGETDVVLVGSLLLRLEIELFNDQGKPVWKDERTESVSFASMRGESLESARREVFDRLARWIVTHFEKEW